MGLCCKNHMEVQTCPGSLPPAWIICILPQNLKMGQDRARGERLKDRVLPEALAVDKERRQE